MGNKGATLIRFSYENTSFCFANCHLESGFSEDLITKRAQQMDAIFETAFVTQRGTTEGHYSLGSHQVKVLLGDFNYRIFREDTQVRRLITLNDFDELFKYDEFERAKKLCVRIAEFEEGPLTFEPTYKYDHDSDIYDTSSKKRVPAWCDRIFYQSDNNLS